MGIIGKYRFGGGYETWNYESELEATWCHCLTPRVEFILPNRNKILDTHTVLHGVCHGFYNGVGLGLNSDTDAPSCKAVCVSWILLQLGRLNYQIG
jgi:hypothetical protein